MYGLGIGKLIGHLGLKFGQSAHTIQHFAFKLLILYFLFKTTIQEPPKLVWCIFFLHILHCGFFIFTYIFNSVPSFHKLFSFLFFFILFKVLGIVQCFSFLSFLPPLTSFGLVNPIPIGIRVLVATLEPGRT